MSLPLPSSLIGFGLTPRCEKEKRMNANTFVTVVNRSSKVVEGRWDGKPIYLKGGEKRQMPLVQAEALQRQNPVMGTLGGEIRDIEFLVGIVEKHNDCSPREQSDSPELLSSDYDLHEGKEVIHVRGNKRLHSRADVYAPPPKSSGGTVLGTDSSFTDPGFEKP